MQPEQKHIYYILGDDERSVLYSPHLDVMRRYGFSVLVMSDPMDAFMLTRLTKYKDLPLTNVAAADLELPKQEEKPEEAAPALAEANPPSLIERFKAQLGERCQRCAHHRAAVRSSPARLVDPQGSPNQEMQRVYRFLNRDFQAPTKVLELNPRHAILLRLNALPADDPCSALVIEQLYEDALLIEGCTPIRPA